MGIGALNYQGVKSGLKLNDVIEEFKYVYQGQEIKAGDFVEYVNGLSGNQTVETTSDIPIDNTNKYAGYTISAIKLDENRVFIAHSYGTSYYLYGIVVTIDGAKITLGTDTSLNGSARSGYTISLVLLQNGNVFIAHSGSTTSYTLYGTIVMIDGTTITNGASKQLNSEKYSGYETSAKLLSNGKVLIIHSYDTYFLLYRTLVTINDTTITAGTATAISTEENSAQRLVAELLKNGNLFIAHTSGSEYATIDGIVLTISETGAITHGTDVDLRDSGVSATPKISYCMSMTVLDNGDVLLVHSNGNNYHLYGKVFTIEGTAIRKGTDTALTTTTYSGYKISSLLLKNGKVFVAHSCNSNYGLNGIILTINDKTITAGTDVELNNQDSTGKILSSILFENGNIFIPHSYDGTNLYLYAQIFGIDEANNIPTNEISIPEYEQQVKLATQPPFDGIALSSGVGGDDTAHNQQVKIARVLTEEEKYITETFTSNPAPTSWEEVEAPTKYIAVNEYGEWQIEGTNIISDYPVCNAFDTDTENEIAFNTYNYSYAEISLPNGVKIKPSNISVKHYITGASSYIQGYNDNSDEWENLGELTLDSGVSAITNNFSYTGDVFYSKFRVYKKSYNSNFPNPRLVECTIHSGTIKYLKPEYQ